MEGKGKEDRGTGKFKDGRNILRKGIADIFHVGFGRFFEGDSVDKLAEYEDLEEKGKLLKLPCTVDDTVFYLFPNDDRKWYIDEMKVCFISMQESQRERMICDIRLENNDVKAYASLCDFGKMVFLTREEAEAALKEMGE